jgi:hypothetical protein
MEKLKLIFVCCLFDPSRENGVKLDLVKNALGKLLYNRKIIRSLRWVSVLFPIFLRIKFQIIVQQKN